jgi:flagellar export protein FliJ
MQGRKPVSRSLQRILKLREMEEEDNRVKFAKEGDLLRGIEAALTTSQKEEQDARSIIFHEISNDLLEGRVLAEGVSRITQLRIDKLKDQVKDQQAKVALRRERYLESRIKRLQLGILLNDEEKTRNADEVRRQQSALDDWFNNSNGKEAGSRGPTTEE